MANDKTEKPPKSPSRRPTTIDLKATEITAAAKPEPAKSNDMSEENPQARPQQQPPEQAARSAAPELDTQAAGSSEPPQSKPDDLPSGNPAGGSARLPWPLIAAGVAGAVLFLAIGMGAGHWLARDLAPVAQMPAPIAQPQPATPPELLDRLTKLEAALAASRGPDPQLLARIAAAEASAKTATELAAARERRSDEIAVIAREARERASSAATTADEAAQKARAASPEQSRAELEAVISRLAAIEEVSRANQADITKRANAAVNDDRSRLAIAALSLRNAVDSGLPFTAELTAMRTLAGDAKSIAALEPFAAGGVPTVASLGRELQATMPAIWKAARANEPAEGSFLGRLQANAGKIVRVRPAGEAVGDDAQSVKARLEMRAGNADIRGALNELAKLPEDARAPAQAWIRKAEARNAALAAAQTLAQSALAALAKPGS
ncbi:MAG: hypothetical protein ABWY35_08555 [Pseudorhodoplanes sp.]